MTKTHELDHFLMIELPVQIGQDEIAEIEEGMENWRLSDKSVHVLNFKNVRKMDKKCYKTFIFYNKTLREEKKYLYCINVNEEILRQIQSDGMAGVLVQTSDMDSLRRKHFGGTKTIDVSIVNPFIEATLNVIETQANTGIRVGRPYVKTGEDPFPIEIAGLIPLNSSASFKGALVLCFQAATFLKIYSNMVGEAVGEITPEIQDGAGELINIIYGQAKTVLNERGHKLDMVLPTVLVGEKLKIRHQSRDLSMILPFESDAGPLFLEVLVEKN